MVPMRRGVLWFFAMRVNLSSFPILAPVEFATTFLNLDSYRSGVGLPSWYVLPASVKWALEARMKSLCRNLEGVKIMESRDTTRGFAERTRRNLELSRQSRGPGSDFHVVTQTVNSLLGIVVVPKARQVPNQRTFSVALADLYEAGWPRWNIDLDEPFGRFRKTERLTDLLRHLRNAAAHGRFNFYGDPDSRDPGKVMIMVEDQPDGGDVNWRCSISAESLYDFCIRLCEFIQASED